MQVSQLSWFNEQVSQGVLQGSHVSIIFTKVVLQVSQLNLLPLQFKTQVLVSHSI